MIAAPCANSSNASVSVISPTAWPRTEMRGPCRVVLPWTRRAIHRGPRQTVGEASGCPRGRSPTEHFGVASGRPSPVDREEQQLRRILTNPAVPGQHAGRDFEAVMTSLCERTFRRRGCLSTVTFRPRTGWGGAPAPV